MWGVEDTQIAVVVVVAAVAVVVVESSEKTLAGVGKKGPGLFVEAPVAPESAVEEMSVATFVEPA